MSSTAASAPKPVEPFSPPDSVTIPGAIALEALALLDAVAEVMADFRLDRNADPFFNIDEPVWGSLMRALGHEGGDDLNSPLCDTMYARSAELKTLFLSHFDAPVLGAISTTKMAYDVAAVQARQELAHV